MTSLANIFTMARTIVKIFLGVKFLFVDQFLNFFVAIVTTFGMQKDGEDD